MLARFFTLPLAITAMLWAGAALAGQPVDLRGDLNAPGGGATLGDLFEGAGAASKIKIAIVAPSEKTMVLDAGDVQRRAHMAGLDWSNPDGYRRLVITITPGGEAAPSSLVSHAAKLVEALTYTRTLTAGQTVRPEDVTWTRMQAHLVPGDAPRDPSEVIGEVARRPVAEGAAVAAHDLTTAQVIKRDQLISVAYDVDGIHLVLQGKALADAHLGEPVPVLNTLSKKTIEAVASGPGEAIAGPQAEALKNKSFASLR